MDSKTTDWIVDKQRRQIPYAGYSCDVCGRVDRRELPLGTTEEEAAAESDRMRQWHIDEYHPSKPSILDGLGAEIDERWVKHLTTGNHHQVHAHYPKKGHELDTKKYIGSHLSAELWKFVTEVCGCNRIAVVFNKPDIEEAMEMSFRRCILTITEDGFVVNIYPGFWYKFGRNVG